MLNTILIAIIAIGNAVVIFTFGSGKIITLHLRYPFFRIRPFAGRMDFGERVRHYECRQQQVKR